VRSRAGCCGVRGRPAARPGARAVRGTAPVAPGPRSAGRCPRSSHRALGRPGGPAVLGRPGGPVVLGRPSGWWAQGRPGSPREAPAPHLRGALRTRRTRAAEAPAPRAPGRKVARHRVPRVRAGYRPGDRDRRGVGRAARSRHPWRSADPGTEAGPPKTTGPRKETGPPKETGPLPAGRAPGCRTRRTRRRHRQRDPAGYPRASSRRRHPRWPGEPRSRGGRSRTTNVVDEARSRTACRTE
jgi:hypothetical protein